MNFYFMCYPDVKTVKCSPDIKSFIKLVSEICYGCGWGLLTLSQSDVEIKKTSLQEHEGELYYKWLTESGIARDSFKYSVSVKGLGLIGFIDEAITVKYALKCAAQVGDMVRAGKIKLDDYCNDDIKFTNHITNEYREALFEPPDEEGRVVGLKWSSSDPRKTIDRGDIIIVAYDPDINKHFPSNVMAGYIEGTPTSICIYRHSDLHNSPYAIEEWPENWYWILQPQEKTVST